MSAKTLTAPQVNALRTGTGRPNTLASLVRLELMDDAHQLTRAGRNIRATLDNGAPTLEHVAFVVREIARTNWNAPQTFRPNEPGARTIAEGRPLFHNGHAVSVVWYPMTGRVYVYAGTDMIGERDRVDDMHVTDAQRWALECIAAADTSATLADWEREVMRTGTVAPERPAERPVMILPQSLRPGMAVMDGYDPDMIIVSAVPTGKVEEDGTPETRVTYTRNGREFSGVWLNYPSWCKMPVRPASVTPDDSHTLVYDVETEGRGVYYRCDGCGSIGPRHSFILPCA